MATQANSQMGPYRRRVDHGPSSFAESVTEGHGPCPIPQAHDRLEECHHWWHEMAKMYHEPSAFRWRLGAFLGAARSVTFMLQAEKSQFEDFSWYEAWQATAKGDPILRWLNENRRLHTHQRSIAPTSWATFRCLFDEDDPRYVADEDIEEEWQGPLDLVLNPFLCTHYYIRSGPREDHPHEYVRYWEAEDLADQELLEVCAAIYDRLSIVVAEGHARTQSHFETKQRLDGEWLAVAGAGEHRLPCMNDTMSHRRVTTSLTPNGDEVWNDDPPHVG
jgi:hypothetical protein